MSISRFTTTALIAIYLFGGCSSDPDDPDPDAGPDIDAPTSDAGEEDAAFDAEGPVTLLLNSSAPDEGPLEGGTVVTLGGQGFVDDMTVFFGEEPSPEVSRQGGLSAQATTPPAAQEQTVDIAVELPDGQRATLDDAFTYFEEQPPEPVEIDYCETETDSLNITAGQPSPPITGLVFVDDITPGPGQGENIDARLLWGPGEDAPEDWSQTVAAEYLEDADGLTDGDLANDRYTVTVTPEQEGNYGYIYQFRLDQGAWVSCNTDGSEGPDDFDPGQIGDLEVEQPQPPDPDIDHPDDCNIQFPIIAESLTLADDEVMVFGRIFEPGMTDQQTVPDELRAQSLVGPPGANPIDEPESFMIVDAVRNDAYAGDDFEEFQAAIALDTSAPPEQAITEAGLQAYLFRFSLDGGESWSHCDVDGWRPDDELDPHRFGALTISEQAPDRVHYCATWTESVTGTNDQEGPTVDMEVFEFGITDASGDPDGDSLEVQVGFGEPGTNPALGYQWHFLDFAGTVEGNDHDFHYAGPLYPQSEAPSDGAYQAITRARISDGESWRYCVVDPPEPYDETADYFLFERTVDLSVESAN